MTPWTWRVLAIPALIVLSLVGAGSLPAQHDTTSFRLTSAVYGNTRNVRVMLPAGYDGSAASVRYPVLLFLDGIAAWTGWGARETVAALQAEGAIPKLVLVTIDNGGSIAGVTEPAKARASEYLPYADQSWEPDGPVPRGGRIDEFLFDEVLPAVTSRFRVRTDPGDIALAGDSYAGVAALHAVLRRPGRVGRLLLESPSLHIGRGQLLRDAATATGWPGRVYIGVGTAEGDTEAVRAEMVSNTLSLCGIIAGATPAVSVLLLRQPGGTHWYDSWRSRLPDALRFLYSSGSAPGTTAEGNCLVRERGGW